MNRLYQFARVYSRFKGALYLLLFRCFYKKLYVGKNVVFKNRPHIFLLNNAIINLADNVEINSSNFGYHINMFAPCKLMADGKNAEIKIGKNTRVHGSCIHAQQKITIGANCLIAANCQIIDSNAHQLSMENSANRINTIDVAKPIIIGDNVWIGAGSIILAGTVIGNGSVISANSVIKGFVPSNCLFGGNPAKILKQY
jgi:acetyltransferase-like isoleucine patch superfamily enzyme